MLENIKTVALVFLVLLSMGLTYQMWFGDPSLKEGIMPKYEYAYFTEPCCLQDIVTPSKIIFLGEEEHVFRRGDKEYMRLWEEGNSVLERLEEQTLKRISDSEKEALLGTASSKIAFLFLTPLPVNFLMPGLTSLGLDIHRAVFILEEHYYYVILEGKDIFAGRIFMNLNEQLLNNLIPQRSCPHLCLPDVLTLNLLEFSCLEIQKEEGENPSDKTHIIADETEDQRQEETSFFLELKNIYNYVPLKDFSAAEIILKKENVDKKQLVRAFFLDPSMARLIEERDGAVFFTDGEKGLRIYPDGLVEYTAPKLERVSTPVSYSAALQKGAENLGFYGGWPSGVYLVRADKQSEGYRLFWETFYEGLPLKGMSGSEMVINDQGVLFTNETLPIYRGGGRKEGLRPFEEALSSCAYL